MSVFEGTIRMVGGFISAYAFSGEKLFLEHAVAIADCIVPHLKANKFGIPPASISLRKQQAVGAYSGITSLAEFGTLQLEFKYLTNATGNPIYMELMDKINHYFSTRDVSMYDGLFPNAINAGNGEFADQALKLGARGDSFYEYLIKQYIQTGKKETQIWDMYMAAMTGVKKRLLYRTLKDNLTYVAESNGGQISPIMDHLVCFIGGTLASDGIPEHMEIAKEVTYTCWQMYERNPTGLAPEITRFARGVKHPISGHVEKDHAAMNEHANSEINNQAAHNLLRPEALESIYHLYTLTGDEMYREWGWKIFLAFEKHCRTGVAFSAINSVAYVPVSHQDSMESFWLAETLKYMYLLFSPPETVDREKYVFNTEAHPIPIFERQSPSKYWRKDYKESAEKEESNPDVIGNK